MESEATKHKYEIVKEYVLKQVQDILEGDTQDEVFTEVLLAEKFGVSRLTARRALKDLEHDGLLRSVRGVGTVVNHNKVVGQLNRLEQFESEWALQGRDVRAEIIDFTHEMPCPVVIALKLGLKMSDNITYIERIRYVEGVPIVVDRRYFPLGIMAGVTINDIGTRPFYKIVERAAKIQIGKTVMEIEASIADKQMQRQLEMNESGALLVRNLTVCSTSGSPIIIGSSYYRGDLFKYVVDI